MAGRKVKLSTVRPGDRVEVDFIDHSQESEGVLDFTVHGVVMKKDKQSIRIGNWVYTDPTEEPDSNCGWYDLAVGAIKEVRKLR